MVFMKHGTLGDLRYGIILYIDYQKYVKIDTKEIICVKIVFCVFDSIKKIS